MANRDEVKGAECYGPCIRQNVYTAGGTIYQGDFVKKNSSGQVVQAAASDALTGVAMAYAVSGGDIMIADHPDQMFRIQSDDATEPAALTACGLNYNIVVASGNTTYKRSGMELDGNTGVTDSNMPLKLLRLDPAVDNAYGANAKCVVIIQFHQHNGSIVGSAGV
jgi:hypothetical protein